MSDSKTYEMLWDCKYCGQKKNLGLTHRFCPMCGGPQDQTARYFPSDEEKVAVEDHVLAGADVLCPACREANSAKANNCRHCGSPLSGAAAVMTRADQLHEVGGFGGDSAKSAQDELVRGVAPAAPHPPAPAKSGGLFGLMGGLVGCGCLSVIGVLLIFLVMFFSCTKSGNFKIEGHRWARTIEVERYGEQRDSAWCDELPPGARVINRTKADRGTTDVPDGEECKTRKKDNGDGTFSEKKECKPKTKKVAKQDDRCTYLVNAWKKVRTAEATGGLGEAPSWPPTQISRSGTCEGCEREGERKERFLVKLAGDAHQECEVPQSKWRALKDGAAVKADVRITGDVVCDSLQSP